MNFPGIIFPEIHFLPRLFLNAGGMDFLTDRLYGLYSGRSENRLRRALAEYSGGKPGGMNAVNGEQIQVGVVDAAVVEIDDGSTVGLCNSLNLGVEIRHRVSVQVYGRSAFIF